MMHISGFFIDLFRGNSQQLHSTATSNLQNQTFHIAPECTPSLNSSQLHEYSSKQPLPDDDHMYVSLSTFWYRFLALITTLGLLVAFVSNAIIMYLFTSTPALRRNPSNIIAINLSISDMLYCVQWPLVIYCCLTQSTWILEYDFVCKGLGFITVSTALVSITTVFVMALKRAIVVKYSIRAKNKITIKTAWSLIAIIWLLCLSSCLPPLFGKFNRFTLDPSKTSCTLDYLTSHSDYKLYILFLYFVFYLIPCVAISISYVVIIVTFKKSSLNLKVASSNDDHRPSTCSFEPNVRLSISNINNKTFSFKPIYSQELQCQRASAFICYRRKRSTRGSITLLKPSPREQQARMSEKGRSLFLIKRDNRLRSASNRKQRRASVSVISEHFDFALEAAGQKLSRLKLKPVQQSSPVLTSTTSTSGGELKCQLNCKEDRITTANNQIPREEGRLFQGEICDAKAPLSRTRSSPLLRRLLGGSSTVARTAAEEAAVVLPSSETTGERKSSHVEQELRDSNFLAKNDRRRRGSRFWPDGKQMAPPIDTSPHDLSSQWNPSRRRQSLAGANSSEFRRTLSNVNRRIRRKVTNTNWPIAAGALAEVSGTLSGKYDGGIELVSPAVLPSGNSQNEHLQQQEQLVSSPNWTNTQAEKSDKARNVLQSRLAKMSLYLILLWLVSWSPIAWLAMLNSIIKCRQASATAVLVAHTMTKLGPAFDVFIYGLSHPKLKSRFRLIIKRMFMMS